MPKLVLIETISQFKHQYVVEIEDDDPISHDLVYRDWETDRKSTRLNSSH